MTRSSILWGVGLACAVGGAWAGNAVGSAPITDRSMIGMFYQSHETAHVDGRRQRVLPNHYPLVTRTGTVPVAQLSERGLFSQARYRFDQAGAEYAADGPGPGREDMDREEVAAAQHDSAFAIAEAQSAQPLAMTAGPGQIAGQAKTINVPATLAMR